MTQIIEIWKENFQEAFFIIKKCIKNCCFVAMDTEFPGTVTRSVFKLDRSKECYFQTLRLNVDSLQLIQLGIFFAEENNFSTKTRDCLQFNFDFSLSENMFAQDSIDLLLRSGVDFECHKKRGVSIKIFTDMLISSGLIFNEKIYWISFHSAYDFGYLVKILTKQRLPHNIPGFLELLGFYFPNFYDIKYLNLFSGNFVGGLNKLAQKLQIDRIGQVHQAGSDSILTFSVFEKLKHLNFDGVIAKKFQGILFGINDTRSKKYVCEENLR